MIVIGNCPYIIDCESVVSKKFKHLDSTKISAYLQSSVLETGILPDWMFNGAMIGRKSHQCYLNLMILIFICLKEGKSYPITAETLQDLEKGLLMHVTS